MRIFDSSAVAITLKRLKEKSVEALEGETILDLTRYELGNIIWRGCLLRKVISPEDAVDKAEDMAEMLEIFVEEVASIDDFRQIMDLAVRLELTFYDASYLYVARSRELTLVTEDKELGEKAKRVGVKAITVNDFLRSLQI